MNRALTLLLIAIITGFTISIRSSLAQGNRGTFTQGTLTCQVDSPSAHCARNFCEGIILYTNTVCNPSGIPDSSICESTRTDQGCTITSSVKCVGNGAAFGWNCGVDPNTGLDRTGG